MNDASSRTDAIAVGAVQAEPVWYDLETNVEKTISLIQDGAALGIELIAFPELWLSGYPFHAWLPEDSHREVVLGRFSAACIEFFGPEHRALEEATRRAGVHVVLGTGERSGTSLFISQMLIGPSGETLMTRRKLRPTGPEGEIFDSGTAAEDLRVVETELGRVSALNCNEHRRPLLRERILAQRPAWHVASWPSHAFMSQSIPMNSDASIRFSRQFAIESGAHVLMPTMTLGTGFFGSVPLDDGNLAHFELGHGASRVLDPYGRACSDVLPADAEGLVRFRMESVAAISS